MSGLPVVGALLELVGYLGHWPIVHWAGYSMAIAGQLLALYCWRKARLGPQPVLYRCPRNCGFLGDQAAVEAHPCAR